MENINRHALSQLTQQQQIVYMAMMMDPKQIPLFNQEVDHDALNTGRVIKEMLDKKMYSKMRLTNDGYVILE